ncbi:hypothetical protein F3J23_12430 [Chryseobacterium sp. Tr-659]|uniref:hypothetical protein n=1 Tax=Chryseobacterium sp. Tr-659 TaxID=2608340 RepID=UPI00142366D9|nr:hypothetical protein [Chryseobacterium sp. Tr-659]NIF06246.1 hypothetical protein [Chryseobacterium sp. Tr-659]
MEKIIKELDKIDIQEQDKYEKILLQTDELYDLSKEADYKKGMVIALTKRALILVHQSNNTSTLKLMPEALSLAEEIGDYKNRSDLLMYKGIALTMVSDYDEARKCLGISLSICDQFKNKDSLHSAKVAIYCVLMDFADHGAKATKDKVYNDSMRYFARKAYDEATKLSDHCHVKKRWLGYTLAVMGSAFVHSGRIKEGEQYFDQAEKIIAKADDQLSLYAIYSERGRLELISKGNKEKALDYYNKAYRLVGHRPRLLEPLYKLYIEYYQKTQNTYMELYYLKKSKRLADSLSSENQSALLSQSRIKEKEAIESYKKVHDNTTDIVVFALGILAIGSGIFLFFYLNKKHKPDHQFSMEKNFKEVSGEYYPSPEKIERLLDLAKRNDSNFLITFQDTFPSLYQKLLNMCDEMTPNDMELCGYLKLNISSKEIATYKKTSVGSVDNRKYRLRKKLGISSETNLYIWISEIA